MRRREEEEDEMDVRKEAKRSDTQSLEVVARRALHRLLDFNQSSEGLRKESRPAETLELRLAKHFVRSPDLVDAPHISRHQGDNA